MNMVSKFGCALTLTSLSLCLLAAGCREHYPHAMVWPSTGDTIPTHPKPPEGGYYSNWDPYACTIEFEPVARVNPVGTQLILIATVKDKDGKALPNRRVEWIVSEGGVGDIVEVDESGWRAARGWKQDNHFAVSHTNNFEHVLDRGNDDPADDIYLKPGQTWCVITSPFEGETSVYAYAPGIYDWSKHKVFTKMLWSDVAWAFPPDATNPTGTEHILTTKVYKHSDGTPLAGYDVNYQIVSGPAGKFDPGAGPVGTVKTDAQGLATIKLTQVEPAAGTNEIKIDIVRPEDKECCIPAAHIATGAARKVWIAPGIAIDKTAPARAVLGDEFAYNIKVSSTSQVPANEVVVTDTLPDGIQYVSSDPGAQVSGQKLTWQLGTMGAGTSRTLTVRVKGTRTGSFHNCAEVVAAQRLSASDCADTVITRPDLTLEKQCTPEVLICEQIHYVLVVQNRGDAPANNVKIEDSLPEGLQTADRGRSLVFNIGRLDPGQSKRVEYDAIPSRRGEFTNKAVATGDGGLSAEASCTTVVREPVLVITKKGPDTRFVGRPVEYSLTVTNKGDADATSTVLVDVLPQGATFVEASSNGTFAEGKVTWNLGTIAPNDSKTVTVTVRATQRGTLRNTATVRATCAEATADSSTDIQGIPAILLEVVDVEDPIEVGSNETYVITVTNQGSADGTNIVVTCILPAEQEFVSASGPTQHSIDEKTVTFAPLPSLDPKATATYRVVVKGVEAGDLRFKVIMKSDQMTSPVEETESTHVY